MIKIGKWLWDWLNQFVKLQNEASRGEKNKVEMNETKKNDITLVSNRVHIFCEFSRSYKILSFLTEVVHFLGWLDTLVWMNRI